jgi:hypothetical protein
MNIYDIFVTTSPTVRFAGTDANVYIELHGKAFSSSLYFKNILINLYL